MDISIIIKYLIAMGAFALAVAIPYIYKSSRVDRAVEVVAEDIIKVETGINVTFPEDKN